MIRFSNILHISTISLVVVFYLLLPLNLDTKSYEGPVWGVDAEPHFIEDLSECTTGLASGLATPDGKPLLWKNRDVTDWTQEYHYVDNGNIPFIGLTYEDNDSMYFAGINAAGFAIENSDIHNLDNPNGHDDGRMMKLALETCRTIEDFQAILDSTDEPGRLNCYNYGVFDAFGGASMFETGRWQYTRFDAADEVDGFLIRANFAFTGEDTTDDDAMSGVHRHDRAYSLWKDAVENGNLTPNFIYQTVVRDLTSRSCDFTSLPYEGYYSSPWETWPYGHVPNMSAINRDRTRSVFIGQGVTDGNRPEDAIIWAMCGSPLACIATPLWVRAGSIPEEYDTDGGQGSIFCHRADAIRNWICEWREGAVDTWRLTNPEGTGIYDFILPLETYFYEKSVRFLESPSFNYDRLSTFQSLVARQAADSLRNWRPTYAVTERFEAIYEDNNIVLIWEEEDDELLEAHAVSGYNVFRSDYPFREGSRGEPLAFVEETRYVDRNPPVEGAFYRIEAVF